jgi:hypothetical protein
MFGIDDLIATGLKILDKVIPDPAQKAEAQLKLLQLKQAGEFKELEADLQMAQGQMDINKIEAASDNLFVAGWRPAVGWVCVLAFAAKYIGGPAVFIAAQFTSHPITLPPIDMVEMLPILLGMLGLGAMRSWDKKNAS